MNVAPRLFISIHLRIALRANKGIRCFGTYAILYDKDNKGPTNAGKKGASINSSSTGNNVNNYNLFKQLPSMSMRLSIPSGLNISQSKIMQYLRCTIFKEHGEITNFNEAISKDELCHEHNLNPRDLRKLNTISAPIALQQHPSTQQTSSFFPSSLSTSGQTQQQKEQLDQVLQNYPLNHITPSSPTHTKINQTTTNNLDGKTLSDPQTLPSASSLAFKKTILQNLNFLKPKQTQSNANPLISISSMTHSGGLQKNKEMGNNSEPLSHSGVSSNANANTINSNTGYTNSEDLGTSAQTAHLPTSSQLPPPLSSLVPSFIVRDDCILINIIDIRCLIKSNMVIVFEQYDYKNMKVGYLYKQHSEFINELSERLRETQSILPYEFRALEAIFQTVVKSLTQEFKYHNKNAMNILQDLEYSIEKNNLQKLLLNNKQTFAFYKKAILCRDMIEDLLDDEQQLLEMYLTNPRSETTGDHVASNISSTRNTQQSYGAATALHGDHTEIEMLLETYRNHVDEIVSSADNLLKSIKTTEEIINIILDSNRNQLLLLSLRFSIGLLSLGGGLFVASLYGMNLTNFIEEDNIGMALIVTIGTLTVSLLFATTIKKLHHLEKITMHPSSASASTSTSAKNKKLLSTVTTDSSSSPSSG